jgi:hypothetical protein
MTIRKGAFPDTVSQPVRQLLEEFYHLSNAASSHNEHEKGMYLTVHLLISQRTLPYPIHSVTHSSV